MTCRRLERTDAKEAAAFLNTTFAADPDSGGLADSQTEDRWQVKADDGRAWVCVEGRRLVGILSMNATGKREVNGVVETFSLFDLLVVDHKLYKAKRSEAVRIARELTLKAADDLRDGGEMTDWIYVTGSTASRGASWSRLLKMEETATNGHSEFWLPFKDIWENARATEKREGLP